MDPKASSLFVRHHSKNNLALEKSTEVEFPIQKTPMDSQPAMFSKFKAYRKPLISAAMSPIVLVCWYQLQKLFSLSASSTPPGPGISQTFQGRWFDAQLSYPLDWGTSEGTTNDSSDPSVGEHVCINNRHSIVPEDGVAKLHTLSMRGLKHVLCELTFWYETHI